MKKTIPYLLIALVAIIILFLAFRIKEKNKTLEVYGQTFFNGQLPRHDLTPILNDKKISIDSHKKTLLIILDTQCEACHSQTLSLLTHIESLSEFNIILTSLEDKDAVEVYIEKFKLFNYPAVKITSLNKDLASHYFLSFPSVLVYSEHGTFVTGFRGNINFKDFDSLLNEKP